MKRKIVIIAVVVCLDLAFIVLMRAGFRSANLSQSIEAPASDPISIARRPADPPISPLHAVSSAEVEQVPVLQATKVYRAAIKRLPRRESRTSKPVAIARSFPHRPGATVPAQQAPVFTDTVIWFQRASYVKDQREDIAVAEIKTAQNSIVPVKQKKKSFFSRALPVIKKPYDWLKSLGSSL